MKNSNKIVVGVAVAAIAFAAVVVVGSRAIAGRAVRPEFASGTSAAREITGTGSMVEEVVDVRSFDEIETSGVWKLEIRHGDEPSVRLSYPDYLEEEVRVQSQGSTLDLGFERDISLRRGGEMPTATIVVAALKRLEMSGATTAHVEGLSEDSLEIEMSGGTNFIGEDCTIGRLRVNSSGAANINLAGSKVRDARIDLSGAGNVEITMDGGELEADLSGATRLVYYGTVSRRDINTSGVSSVRQR